MCCLTTRTSVVVYHYIIARVKSLIYCKIRLKLRFICTLIFKLNRQLLNVLRFLTLCFNQTLRTRRALSLIKTFAWYVQLTITPARNHHPLEISIKWPLVHALAKAFDDFSIHLWQAIVPNQLNKQNLQQLNIPCRDKLDSEKQLKWFFFWQDVGFR